MTRMPMTTADTVENRNTKLNPSFRASKDCPGRKLVQNKSRPWANTSVDDSSSESAVTRFSILAI